MLFFSTTIIRLEQCSLISFEQDLIKPIFKESILKESLISCILINQTVKRVSIYKAFHFRILNVQQRNYLNTIS